MCLAAFAIGTSERFPLVIASNRDEFNERPTGALAWWPTSPGGTEILAGRDLRAGGTWLGLTAAGRLALLTNIRNPARQRPDAPSRGDIVTRWLTTRQDADAFWRDIAAAGHNGFNLIAADFTADPGLGCCHWMNSDRPAPERLGQGVFGLSNGLLDEPWPKVVTIREQLASALAGADVRMSSEDLASRLLGGLCDARLARDEHLPATGVPIELERQLSAVFIRTPDGRYGTRSSTVLITERLAQGWSTTLWERTHATPGSPQQLRRVVLPGWPSTSADGGLAPTQAPAAGRFPVVTLS